jgi:sec-independent protein translocase protein TatA
VISSGTGGRCAALGVPKPVLSGLPPPFEFPGKAAIQTHIRCEMGSLSIWHFVIVGEDRASAVCRSSKISDIVPDFAKGIKSFREGIADDDRAPEVPGATGNMSFGRTRMKSAYLERFVPTASLVLLLTLSSFVGSSAQERSLAHDGLHSKKLLILRHLAPTGAVVPKLGEPQIGPATGVNKRVQGQDHRITHSICSNCGVN